MLNVIKMDIYRMFKSRYTWIIAIAAMALMVISVALTYYQTEDVQDALNSIPGVQSVGDDVQSIITVEADTSLYTGGDISAAQLYSDSVQGGVFTLFIIIFSVLYVNEERKTGFIKNIAGQVSNRGFLIVSKLCSVVIFTLILFIAVFIATMLGSAIFFNYVILDGIGDYIPYYTVQLLLHVGFGGLITCIVIVLKNSVASMFIGMIAHLGGTSMICSLADRVIHNIGISNTFSLSNYTLTSNIGGLAFDSGSGDLSKAFIVAIAFIIITTGVSMFTLQKQDIR